MPGWSEDLTGIRRWSDLPAAARNYVEFLAQQVGVPASIVSVGPDRGQTILVPSAKRLRNLPYLGMIGPESCSLPARGVIASRKKCLRHERFQSSAEEGLARMAEFGLKPEQLPRHIAIIMDGNGRWAQRRGLPRIVGHRRGIQSVRDIVEEGCRLGLDQLTLYCLSVENWKRPPRELKFLMRLLRHFLIVERDELMDQNVQLRMIGRREGLPGDVLEEFDRTSAMLAENTGMTLCLAVNYGGRTEIGDAARRLAEDVRAGADRSRTG